MKKIISSFIFLVGLLSLSLFNSCSLSKAYDSELNQLDSLLIVLNNEISDLNKNDTNLIQLAVSKFEEYKLFISTNFKDTINRESGNALLNFIKSGENLGQLEKNRKALFSRAKLSKQQIANLIEDANNGSVSGKDFETYYIKERNNCVDLIKNSKELNLNLPLTIQAFRTSLIPVENLIKEKNNGALPNSIINKASI